MSARAALPAASDRSVEALRAVAVDGAGNGPVSREHPAVAQPVAAGIRWHARS